MLSEDVNGITTFQRTQDWQYQDLWMLTESENSPGYFYIKNLKYHNFRLTKSEEKEQTLVQGYDGNYFDNQLWRFERIQQNDRSGYYYRIYNKYNPDAKLAKYGPSADQWGTFNKADNYPDQIWELIPRFNVKYVPIILEELDNRQGTRDIEISTTYEKGLVLTNGSKFSTRRSVTSSSSFSVSATVGAQGGGFSGSSTISHESSKTIQQEISTETSSQSTNTTKNVRKTQFIFPAGTHTQYAQLKCQFTSLIPEDNYELHLKKKVFTSSESSLPYPTIEDILT